MTVGQLELPLEAGVDTTGHTFTLRWHPEGRPDGTYTLTCDCDKQPLTAHSWAGWQQLMDQHCREAA